MRVKRPKSFSSKYFRFLISIIDTFFNACLLTEHAFLNDKFPKFVIIDLKITRISFERDEIPLAIGGIKRVAGVFSIKNHIATMPLDAITLALF